MIDNDLLICWGAMHRKVEKGRTIFYEGDKAHFYYQVVSGKVKMVNVNEAGKEFIQGLFGSGQSFGEPPLFCGETYPACAVADEDTVLLRLSKERFLQLLRDNTDIHFAFTALLAQRLRLKTILSKDMTSGGAENLIGALIRRFAVAGNPAGKGRARVELTRQEIADMTGLRVETVIRTIRNMYRKGEVLLERGKVYV
jgi:CRP/FNR family transcriptional regulator